MCHPSCSVRSPLPVDSRAPALARALLDRACCEEHHGGVRGPARLLVSELVTNALRHGAAPITVEVGCERGAGVSVRVSDEGPSRPVLRRPVAAHRGARGGWGLVFVDLLSDAWGVDEAEFGKTVWFRLRPPPEGARRALP